jgi:dynein heavy chain
MYEESMNTVLQQEVIRYNKLVSAMHKSLKDLQLALKGIVVMSGELEAMADSLFNNFVPEVWSSKAFPSLKPLSLWIQELLDRLSFIQNWIDHGIPKVYWISGFFFPQAFLTGTLQNYARRRQISISTVSYVFKVLTGSHDDIKEAPPNGCYVYGLFVEGISDSVRFHIVLIFLFSGARWGGGAEGSDMHTLIDSKPKELFTQMAPIWFKCEENRVKPKTGIYDCPCYKILTRKGASLPKVA